MKAPLFGIRSALPLYSHIVQVQRSQKGTFENGRWITQEKQSFEIKASVQTAIDKELEDVDEGRRVNGGIRIYTDTKLQTADIEESRQPDLVNWEGNSYLVEKVSSWNQDGGYYKVIATRINQ